MNNLNLDLTYRLLQIKHLMLLNRVEVCSITLISTFGICAISSPRSGTNYIVLDECVVFVNIYTTTLRKPLLFFQQLLHFEEENIHLLLNLYQL